jgi:hypothetical protein
LWLEVPELLCAVYRNRAARILEGDAMTKDQKGKYLQSAGTRCPYCASPDTGSIADIEHLTKHEVEEIMMCNACFRHWTNIYTLTNVTPID